MAFHDTSLGIFMTRVLAFPQHVSFLQDVGFPRNESWHLHATGVHGRGHSYCYPANKPTRNLIVVIATGRYIYSLVK